jgi:NHS family xanthosine MFS transporter
VVAFDFFNNSGSLFVERETDDKIRSSAQGVFMIMTNGFGAFIVSYVLQDWCRCRGWPNAWYVFATYSLVVALVFAFVLNKA